MIKFLFTTLFLGTLLMSPIYARKKTVILNKIAANTKIEWESNKRSIENFAPFAIYENNTLYIYSYFPIEDARLTIKDAYNTIVYSTTITVLPNENTTSTLPISNGDYIIELECNEDYYYGYFEID